MTDFKNERITLQSAKIKIKANRCKCNLCGDVIESKGVHDLVRCSCGRIFTDGGKEYVRRGCVENNDITDLTEYE